MKPSIAGLLALALSAAPVAAQTAAASYDLSRLTPLTLSYRVLSQGNPVATQRVFIVREGNGWLRTDTVVYGQVTQVLKSAWGDDFSALSHLESFSGPLTGEAAVRVANGRVTGQATLPEQAGGQRSYDLAAVPGMVFDGQDHAALAVAELQVGQIHAFPMFKVNTGTVVTRTYRVTGVDTVTVAAGVIPAFRLQMTGEQAVMNVWLRQEGLHVPVKFEVEGAPLVVELQ